MNMTEIVNALFKDRSKWKQASLEDKEKFFFIINRNLSKIWPEYSHKWNNKGVDTTLALDVWFWWLSDKVRNKWGGVDYSLLKRFWAKADKCDKEGISLKDKEELAQYMEISMNDLDYMIKFHSDVVNDEYKWMTSVGADSKKIKSKG